MYRFLFYPFILLVLSISLQAESIEVIGKSNLDFSNLIEDHNELLECQKDAHINAIDKLKRVFYTKQKFCTNIDANTFDYTIKQEASLANSFSRSHCFVKKRFQISFEDPIVKQELSKICSPQYSQYPQKLMLSDPFWFGVEIATGLMWVSNDSITLYKDNTYINYQYSNTMLYTFDATMKVKTPWIKQLYFGAIAHYAFSTEGFTDDSSGATTIRNDGTPGISRYGYGAIIGYRLNWDFDVELQSMTIEETVERNYSDGQFKAKQSIEHVSLKVGWYISSKLKFWGRFNSESSISTGLSWEFY